jgi:hypothetical protein
MVTMPPPNQRERAEKKRLERLASMEEQVKDGSLTIRKMTPEEQKQWEKADAEGRTRRSRQQRS